VERLEVWATVLALDTFGVLVSGRPPSIDSHLTSPVQYFPEDIDGVSAANFPRRFWKAEQRCLQSEEHFVTLQDLFDGDPVKLAGEKPSGYVLF
jgi:hypothetical protein